MSTRSLVRLLAGVAVFLAVAVRGLAESPRGASAPDLAANKQVMTRFLEEVWNGGDLELCDELVGKDGVAHYRGHPLPAEPAEVKQIVSRWRDGLAGFQCRLPPGVRRCGTDRLTDHVTSACGRAQRSRCQEISWGVA
ncbi:MAG TPA: hypothetical protein VJA16_11385 [Thermoanaerobaculia bacterium]